MSNKIKNQIARILSSNCELNKKALKLKKSWDEVQCLLSAISPCKRECNKSCNKKK